MGFVLAIWVILGIVGVIVYLVRMGYLWTFINEQILSPLRQSMGGDDLATIFINMFLVPIMVLAAMFFKNLILLGGAVVLGPISIVIAMRIEPEEMIRLIPTDIESAWKSEARGTWYTHYYAGEYVFRCIKCETVEVLEQCTVCDCHAYGPEPSGISCRKCDQSIYRWTCPECNHINPVKIALTAVRPKFVSGGW